MCHTFDACQRAVHGGEANIRKGGREKKYNRWGKKYNTSTRTVKLSVTYPTDDWSEMSYNDISLTMDVFRR